jgi:beta-galactosidase
LFSLSAHAQETLSDNANQNLGQNFGFENQKVGWEIVTPNGGAGAGVVDTQIKRSGNASLKLSKTNSSGWVELRATKPIQIKPGVIYTFRGWFHAENAPLTSLLLFRIGGAQDESFNYNSIDRSAGYSSQSLLRNSPPGKWEKRVITYKSDTEKEIYPHVILWGNPATVWLDDLEISAAPYKIVSTPGAPYVPEYSRQQVEDVLQKRASDRAELEIRNGVSTLLLNGKAVPAVLYKGLLSSENRGDYAAFGKSGIPFSVTTVRLGPDYYDNTIWKGKNQYDWKALDDSLMSVLQKNPNAHIILDVWVYPYKNWGEENPDDLIRNEKGERAYGGWGNVEGFANDLKDEKKWWYPSYHSPKWRDDASAALEALAHHLAGSTPGKAVAGFFISGGHDGQFINHHFVDYSAPAQTAFRNWIRARYDSLESLNRVWKTDFKSWEEIVIPAIDESGHQEKRAPYLAPGAESDYREFRDVTPWQLRDAFAGVLKKNIGKPVVTLAYGSPIHRAFFETANLDGAGSMTYYPYRVAGYSTGWKQVNSFPAHHKIFFQELDLRSWVADGYGEVYSGWIGAGRTPQEWDAINRKLVGLSLANDWGYWYYDMNQYFNAPEIHRELQNSFNATQKYFAKQQSPAHTKWKPDVALITTDEAQKYISARFNAVGTPHSAGVDYQGMILETSCVPYDKQYLQDVLDNPELQNYKVFIFENTVFLSEAQRAQIKAKLQKGNRTLIWLYDSGYISENGKSAQAMSDLTGLKIQTEEKYERLSPMMENGKNPLLQNVQPFQGGSEMMLAMFGLRGSVASFSARPQPFWIEDESATVLARYAETNRAAMALKKMPGWTSIYIGAPNALGGDLLNNIARQAGAYIYGAPGQAVNMNADFVSLHAMKSATYTLRLPKNRSRVRDALTGKVLAEKVSSYSFPVQAQSTYWFFLE